MSFKSNLLVLFSTFFLISCGDKTGHKGSLFIPREILESYTYPYKQRFDEVVIGNQTWMKYYLITTKFQNGDLISHCQSNQEWVDAYNSKTPAWCYYGKIPSPRGLLYNKFAIYDKRGLAPQGYHLPSEKEIIELSYFFKRNWYGSQNDNYNESLVYEPFFETFLGARNDDGSFFGAKELTLWASSNDSLAMTFDSANVMLPLGGVDAGGYYVRCIKN